MENNNPVTPALLDTVTDVPRAALECLSLGWSLRSFKDAVDGNNHPVVVIPGFGGGDGSTYLLRRWLARRGYNSLGWGLGRNFPQGSIRSIDEAMAFRDAQVRRLAEQLDATAQRHGEQPSLIGWSMGGLYACELANQYPDHVKRVVTLGTPHGDPRNTAAWRIMKAFYRSKTDDGEQDVSGWMSQNRPSQGNVPIYVIFSHRDGLVHPSAAGLNHDNAKHIRVDSSHVGFTANPQVYRRVAEILASGM